MKRLILNPNAPDFVPFTTQLQTIAANVTGSPRTETSLSSEEEDELRSVDQWIQMMADLEELEVNHLINLALKFASPSQIEEIHRRNGFLQSISEN
mmetsp:Transcript_38917/g.54054  ORF Transcript_38917/g.54054 Transcript_38917/m.54054 type:complete len:96 (+) Transcript_38917:83-370(+)